MTFKQKIYNGVAVAAIAGGFRLAGALVNRINERLDKERKPSEERLK